MILLRADHQLKVTFDTLIETMKIPVTWNGTFVVLDNYMILQGEVRSLFFHFDTKKVATNIIDIPMEDKQIEEIDNNVRLQNAINMILYAFGKWGTIKGLKVDKTQQELGQLFAGIMKEYGVEPEYTMEYLRFYRGGIRITYEDVIQMAIEYQEENASESDERNGGLWRKIIWEKERAAFERVETTIDERRAGRLGRNFYMVGYLCPECGKKLYMVVYPHGREFCIETDEGGVLLARAAACDHCHIFYTPRPKKLFIEGDIYAMDFGEDTDAYEDYLDLLGRDGAKVSNYHCNEYADKRKRVEDAEVEDDETLEEVCAHLPELTEVELRKITARIEEGFYSDESAGKYEGRIKAESDKHKRMHRQDKERDSKRDNHQEKEAEPDRGRIAEGKTDTDRGRTAEGKTDTDRGRTAEGKTDTNRGRTAEGKTDTNRGRTADRKTDTNRGRTVVSGNEIESGRNSGKDTIDSGLIVTSKEHEAARRKYEARFAVVERYSERQLKELKGQLERERHLTPQEKAEYLTKVEEKLCREREEKLLERVDACEGKTYAIIKRVLNEVEQSELPAERKQALKDKLIAWKNKQAEIEVRQLMQKMPPAMDRGQYQQFVQRVKEYEGVDVTPYEEQLRNRREAAEKLEIANMVKRARKITREDMTELVQKLKESDFLPELVLPYIEKVDDKIREMDAGQIALICPNPMQMTFEEGMAAYEKIESGDFLPDLKTDTLKMLAKRLAKLKTDECELLVQKLRCELEEAGIVENSKHHFYPARKVLLHQATSQETELIDFAMASYAAGKGLFEYPILVVDSTRNGTGKEGIIITPDHLYYSTLLNAYGISIASISEISASTGLLNKGLYVHQRNGEKIKIPYAVESRKLPDFARVLNDFVHYLQEKPDSRNLTYLASEKHDTICCFRCGYTYKGNDVCPKCGYQNNG